ncbi:unnamed protein product [Dovyalis caffra]|uniref:Uncharacterized protein n=1 Tax=Dovyalis caffra TaxID=77055 RepID=A0AAV1RQ20_9ROSI|nr:unnamed protein product [Dovyalis caffra]
MAIEEYCGEELELYLQILDDESSFSTTELKEIGVHVIVDSCDNQRISPSVDVEEEDEIDSQESEWERDHDIEKLQGTTSSGDVEGRDEIDSQSGTDRVIFKLYHSFLGSIAASTRERWITYLLKTLQARYVVAGARGQLQVIRVLTHSDYFAVYDQHVLLQMDPRSCLGLVKLANNWCSLNWEKAILRLFLLELNDNPRSTEEQFNTLNAGKEGKWAMISPPSMNKQREPYTKRITRTEA